VSRIIPIPTTRVGDLFVRQRLVGQTQLDQLELFRLQTQISTGQRLQLPSEDAPAALRAINLQRLLDRKGQIQTNLKASNSYLSAAEDRLGHVSTILSDLRGSVVGVAGTVVPEAARQELVQEIDRVLSELVSAGNAKYQGRYLFAGSQSQVQPYDFNGPFVEYIGNEGVLRSFVDLERLFETNLSGTEVFGGISADVQGAADLNPHLAPNTLVSTLNGGNGIGSNPAVAISVNTGDSTETSVVDLSGAVTIGDVARAIERAAPAGTNVSVEVGGDGLVLRTDADSIIVGEVAQGRTARQLGILSPTGAPASDELFGGSLNPALLKTTSLASLLGTKAQGVIRSVGSANNDIALTATSNGDEFNDLIVVFDDNGLIVAGDEVATYDANTNTLTVQVQAGVSTANQVAAAITTEGTFTAAADYHDALSTGQIGTNPVDVSGSPYTLVTTGGGGENLDTTSGLILTNGGQSVTLDISGADTVEDFLNLVNGAGLGLVAEINAAASGINIRSRLSGSDFTIGENGGATATQLGIRTYTEETKLADLNRGVGVPTTSALETLDTDKLDALTIVSRNGVNLSVDLSTANSLQEVVDAINGAAGNNVTDVSGTTAVLARLSADGNGVELVDSSTPISGGLQVVAPPGTAAAEYLGFVAPAATEHTSSITDPDGNHTLSGRNVLGHDMQIVASDGTSLWIDLAGTKTVQDVIDRINSHPANVPANVGDPPPIEARLAATGNGIELVDESAGVGTLSVRSAQGSQAAEYLGFVASGETESDPDAVRVEGASQLLTSQDRHTLEADSVFNTLLRLKTALEQNDDAAIGQSLELLDTDLDRVNFARAELGGRIQNLEIIDVRLQDENVQLKSALSQDIDVDLVEAISNLTARQYAFEASLRTSASIMQMTLLNFI
jgi:flagellin-like hook-associated protein FlgL